MNGFFAFLAIEEENIAGLYVGVLCAQGMYSVGGNDQRPSGTQPGIQKCILQIVHTAGQNFHTAGFQACLNKFVANTDTIIPVRSCIGNSGLAVITGSEFCGKDGQ